MADFQTTVELRAQTGQLTQKLNQTERQLKQVSTQVRKTQGAFTRMGRKVSGTFTKLNRKIKEHRTAIAGIGISLGLIVAKGVKDFKEWEDGLAQIATLGVTGISAISDELDAVRREFGISGAEATKGYYDIISAGASQGAEAMGQLTAATKLAKAGNTDLAAAIDVVTSGMNIFGDNGETATSIVDQLFLAVKYGKTTVEELGKTFGYVAPVIDAAGLSMADYAASMATVTAGGIATKQATTGLKAVLSNLIKVTPKAAKKAKELGLDFGVSALKAKGLVGVMQDIADATQGDVTELGYLFDSIEAINAVAVLTSNTGLKSLERNFNAMSDSAGTTEEALAKVKATASYNFGKFNQGLNIMSRSIGAAVVPSLLDMAEALAPVVEFISALITQHPGIIKITLAVTALGVALAFLGGPITLGIIATGVALKALSDHFDIFADGGVAALEKIELVWDNFWAGFAGKDLRETINYIFSGVGDWVGDLLPKGGFTKFWDDTEAKLTEFWTNLSGWFTKQQWAGIWDDTVQFVGDIWSGVKTALTLMWVSASKWFQTTDWAGLWSNYLEFVGDIWGGVFTALKHMWTNLVSWFTTTDWKSIWSGKGGNPHADGGVLGFVGDIWGGVKSALTVMWNSLTAWFNSVDWAGLWAGTLNFVGDVWSGVKTGVTAMWTSLTNWFSIQDWDGLWSGTLSFVGDVWSGVKSGLTTMWNGITNWFSIQDWSGLWKGTLEFTGDIWGGIKNHLVSARLGIELWFKTADWGTLWDNTLEFAGDIWTGVKNALNKMWNGITNWFSSVDWSGIWSGNSAGNPHSDSAGVLGFAGDIWSGVKSALSAMWTGLTTWFTTTDWKGLWKDTIEFSGDIWAGIKTALDFAWTNLTQWHSTVDWTTVAEAIGTAIHTAFMGVFKFGAWLATGIADGIIWAATAVTSGDTDWSAVFQGLMDAVTGLAGFIGKIILAAFGIKWSDVQVKWDEFITSLKDWFGSISFAGVWDGLLDALKGIGPAIKSYIMSLIPSFADLKAKVSGGVSAVTETVGNAKDSVVDAASNVKNKVVDFFSFSKGGAISGDGTGTSDSIPALLSNGEFVMNAKSTGMFGPLLEMMNKNKFAKGGMVGKVQNFADGGSVSEAKSYQFLQFEEGIFSMTRTIDKFIGNMDMTDPAVNKVVRQLEYLQKHTGNLNKDQVLAHDYATRINMALINLLPKKKEEAKVTAETAGAVKDLGDAAAAGAEGLAATKNEFEGFGASFTGPIKQALANGGSIGDAFKKGAQSLFQRLANKFLDKAFEPLERALDEGLNSLFSSISSQASNLFSGMGGGGGGGDGIGRIVGQLFGGMMMSKGGIVPEKGMRPQYFAHGGMAKGTDTIPAMLTPGEMVLTEEQQKGMGGGVTINQTLNITEAMDPQKFQSELLKNNKVVVGLVQQAYQKRGQLGPTGYGQ